VLWVIAFGSPDSFAINPKVNKAAGRRAVVMVFASPSGQFYRDVTISFHLPGLSHLDNFIVTQKSYPLTGTLPSRQLYLDTKILPVYQDFAIWTT